MLDRVHLFAKIIAETEKLDTKPKSDSQTIIDENRKSIRVASNEKILRRQMELLAEYSRLPDGNEHIAECSLAMVLIYRELVKAEREVKS